MSAERRARIVELARVLQPASRRGRPVRPRPLRGRAAAVAVRALRQDVHLQLVVLEDDLAGPPRRLVHPPRGARGRAHRGRGLDVHHAGAAEPGDRVRVHPPRQLRAEPRADQRPAQGAARRDARGARQAPLGLHVDAPAGRLLHLARVPAGHAREGRAREGRRASRSSPASTAAACRTPRGSPSASSPPRRSSWASSGSPRRSSSQLRGGDDGAAGRRRSRVQRARDEPGLGRRLERPPGGPEGRARPLERRARRGRCGGSSSPRRWGTCGSSVWGSSESGAGGWRRPILGARPRRSMACRKRKRGVSGRFARPEKRLRA